MYLLYYCTQFAIRSSDIEPKYLIRQNRSFNVSLYDSTTILNNYKKTNDFLVYHQLTHRMDMMPSKTEMSFITAIPEHIIKQFGFNLSLS